MVVGKATSPPDLITPAASTMTRGSGFEAETTLKIEFRFKTFGFIGYLGSHIVLEFNQFLRQCRV